MTGEREILRDRRYIYHAYKVFVEDSKNERTHRIFTMSTVYDYTAAEWFLDVRKSCRNSHGKIVVGVWGEVAGDWYNNRACRHPAADDPYSYLYICTGSQCMIYHLPEPGYHPPKCFAQFFTDPNVVAVSVGVEALRERMALEQRIWMKNVVDLGTLALEGLQRQDLDLGRYDLDQLAKAVLGKHMDVIRPGKDMKWFDKDTSSVWDTHYFKVFTPEKVAYATLDAYLCFLIGTQLYDMIKDRSTSKKDKKNRMNRKNKNPMKKN